MEKIKKNEWWKEKVVYFFLVFLSIIPAIISSIPNGIPMSVKHKSTPMNIDMFPIVSWFVIIVCTGVFRVYKPFCSSLLYRSKTWLI